MQRLTFDGFSRVGTYTGSIYLDGALRRQKVSVSVLVTHGMVGALLAIVLGVWLGWRLEQWLRTERARYVFRLDILRLGESFKQAESEFASTVRGVVETTYSLAQAVELEQGRLLGRYESLIRGGHLDPQDTQVTALETRLIAAHAAIEAWPKLARALVALKRTLGTDVPANVEALLRGGPLGLGEVGDKVKEVQQAALPTAKRGAEIVGSDMGEPRRENPGDPFRRAVRWLGRRDRFFGAVFLAATVLLALKEVYLDKPMFGTPSNYVEALLWGLGAKLGLDALRQLGGTLLARLPVAGR